MKKPHLHLWDTPSVSTRMKLGSYSWFLEECSICGKLRLAIGRRWSD